MEAEGVIKYELSFKETPLAATDISFINGWRELLVRVGLVGQDAGRYGGLGFGNLSMRTAPGFLITGSQTGEKHRLTLADYAEVIRWRLQDNVIEARGQIRPSSEALTHASIYDARKDVDFVFHCHSPDIWRAAKHLDLMTTDVSVPYGTPAMAQEVGSILSGMDSPGILVMGGHEDGIVAFGSDADQTGIRVMGCLAKAIRHQGTLWHKDV